MTIATLPYRSKLRTTGCGLAISLTLFILFCTILYKNLVQYCTKSAAQSENFRQKTPVNNHDFGKKLCITPIFKQLNPPKCQQLKPKLQRP
jgi:hypothetical protein